MSGVFRRIPTRGGRFPSIRDPTGMVGRLSDVRIYNKALPVEAVRFLSGADGCCQ